LCTAELKIPLNELVEEAVAARPEIRAEDHLVRARERSVTLAKMGYLPDFSIGGQYMGIDGHMGVPGFNKDGHDIWAATIGLSVPIWIDRVRARLDETKAQLQQERFARRNVEDTVNDQIQDAYERLMAAARKEAIYRTTLLPQTAERIRAAQAGYQTGTVDFLTLIDSLKSYEDVRLLDYQSVRNYQTAGADLTRAVGRPIPGVLK
jgi:cobalt-zinc-cadmium efflux system outer membrane protein